MEKRAHNPIMRPSLVGGGSATTDSFADGEGEGERVEGLRKSINEVATIMGLG